MDELDDGCCANVLLALVAQGSRGKQYDQRPQSFTAAHDDVFGNLGNERYVALQAPADESVHGLHVVVGQRRDVFEGHGIGFHSGHLHTIVMMPESHGLGEIRAFFQRPIVRMQALEMRYNSVPPGR